MEYIIKVLLILSTLSTSCCFSKILRDVNICGNPVCKGPVKFGFHNWTSYKYAYKISTSTRFDGTGSNSSNLNIAAVIEIKFKSQCEGILEIASAEISHGADEIITKNYEENRIFNSALTENPLRFFFEDGTISQICPSKRESVWGLNIKRGILSSFQNTMERFDLDQHSLERDVNGDCLVEYLFKEVNGTTLIVKKNIDLLSCVNRHQIYSIIPLTPYIFQKKYHKWTPMNSFVRCTQHIDHKVHTAIYCEEEHAYQPFYNQTNGAKTVSKSEIIQLSEDKLSFTETSSIKELGEVESRRNLLFDHSRPKRATHDNLYECKKQITFLCELHTVEFQPKYPDSFNRLIHIARDLSTDALTKLYKDADKVCETGRKHMLDALPYIRSKASIKVMTAAVVNREIPSNTVNEWMLAMAFYPRPDYDIIESVSELMQRDYMDNQTMFSISTIVNGFCTAHEKCGSYPYVSGIVQKLESMFNKSCTNLDDVTKANIALKSIGNAGVMTETLERSLKTCMMNDQLDLENRISAISAHRRLPCGTNLKYLLKLYQNQTNTEEVRIAAYLQLIRCPSYIILKEIRNILEDEEYNQVGSFVWSHLKNQMKSAQASRVEIQAMLQDEELSDKFNKDIRQYSHSYETSFYLNRFGLGGFYETHIIFSHKSYIPRSLMFNFTLDIFGESINVYEITFHIEGLEWYAEKLFYADGPFSKDAMDKFVKLFRFVRSTPNPLKSLINSIPFKKILDEIKITTSIKMFGNELKYYTVQGTDEFLKLLSLLNPVKVIEDFLSGQEIKFDRSAMLIDTSYITPMSTGIPVKLNTIGTAAINLNVRGYMNSSNYKANNDLELNGKLTPSIGVNIEGSMEVDAFISQTGVKFKASVFTSSALEGVFTMNSLDLIRVSFYLPLQKSEIFHAETLLMLVNNNKEIILNGVTAGRKEKNFCSWSILDDTVGLKLCATTVLPNSTYLLESPLFLFSGPLKFAVSLIKSDPTANTYIVEYKLDRQANKTLIVLKFETPGSKTNRGMKAVIDLDIQSQNLTLAYQSSLTKVEARGFYRNTKTDKLVNFGLVINGKKHIDIHVGVQIIEGKYGNTYLPKLQFSINGKSITSLSGSIKWISKKGVSQCHVDLNFNTSRFTIAINGGTRRTDISFAVEFKLDYKFEGRQFETVRIELKIDNKSTKFLTHYKGRLKLDSTAYPEVNMITSLRYQKAHNHVDCFIEVTSDPSVAKEDELLMVLHYQKLNVFSFSKMNISTSIVKPSSEINVKLQFSQTASPSNSSKEVIVQYATGKSLIINLDVNIPLGTLLYFDYKLGVTLPTGGEKMLVILKVLEKMLNEFDLDIFGRWFSGHTINMKGSYMDKTTNLVTNHNFKVLARSDLFNDILLIGRYLDSEMDYKTDLQAEHNKIKYGLSINHSIKSPGYYQSIVELLYNRMSYTLTSYLDSINKKANIELHLDRYRDVHLVFRGVSNKTMVDSALDLKWDANRDPSQKITASVLSNSYGNLNYDGKCIIEYPGRIINSFFMMKHNREDYILTGSVHWSIKDTIKLYLHGFYDLPKNGIAKLNGKLETPFKKWEQLTLGYQIQLEKQKLNSNGNVMWQKNERVDIEVSYNYGFDELSSVLSFLSVLNSTIPEVNSMQAVIRYSSYPNDFNTGLIIQTNSSNIVSLAASGSVMNVPHHLQYNGSFHVETPFALLRKTGMTGELNVYPHNFVANLRIIGNGKKYITRATGSMRVLTESVLNFHIETPFEKYKSILGKFAFSASNKTGLANLFISSTPALESEIIYFYQSTSNFNLRLKIYTSLSAKHRLLLVGKINPDTVDARFILNSFELGLLGRSHYTSWKDIDYSLKIYTPIDGYHRGAAMAKMILEGKVDFEASVSLAERKVGLKVQAMLRPEDKFALPFVPPKKGNDTTEEEEPIIPLITLEEIYMGDSYWRGVFQLDTPMYPTVHGIMQINEDGDDYNVIAYVSFPFLQLRMADDFTFVDYLNIKNNFDVTTSCYCFSAANSSFSLQGKIGRTLDLNLDANAHSYENFYTGFSKLACEYVADNLEENSESNEGTYRIGLEVETPLSFLKRTLMNGKLKIENPLYTANVTFEMNNNLVVLNGELEIANDYFESDVELKINTSLFNLPWCTIYLNKDFIELERKMIIKIGLPNEKGTSIVHYGIRVGWLHDAPSYMKYAIIITTPYPTIGVVESGVEYSGNIRPEEYRLETYLRYTNKTEMKALAIIKKQTFSVKIDSTFNSYRKINIGGNFKNEKGGKSFETTFKADKTYRLQGFLSLNKNSPIKIELLFYQLPTHIEFVSFKLNSEEKKNRRFITAIIKIQEKLINVYCDYGFLQQIGINVNFLVNSQFEGYEALSLNGVFLNKEHDLTIYKINTNVKSQLITREIKIKGDVLLKDKGGIFRINLNSESFHGDANLQWMIVWFELLSFDITGKGKFGDASKELISHVHFWNVDNDFQETSFSVNIDFNKRDWWLCTNATLLWPSWNNLRFMSFAVLPHKMNVTHTVLSKLFYNRDYSYITYIVKYIKEPNQFDFISMSEVVLKKDLSTGVVLLKTGKHRIFDNFKLKKVNNVYDIHNILQSTNMKEDLSLDINYQDLMPKKLVRLFVYYPWPHSIVNSDVDFEAINNFKAEMNFSTVFKAFPHVNALVNLITTRPFYQRFGQIKWTNKTALMNYTHVSQLEKEIQLTEGNVFLVIPLTTVHYGHLNYIYNSTETKADGYSKLLYNNDIIMSGTYIRNSKFTKYSSNDLIEISVNNSYAPAGIIYGHNNSRQYPLQDIRRIELFKLNNKSRFHVTGEYEVVRHKNNKLVTVRGFNKQRMVTVQTFSEGDTIYISNANFSLKPNVWFGSGFKIINKEHIQGKQMEFNISFPRRHFAIIGDYEWTNMDFKMALTLEPNKFSFAKNVTGNLHWHKIPSQNANDLLITIKHASFLKDIIFHGYLSKNRSTPLVVTLTAEYSMDPKKKLNVNGIILNLSKTPKVFYQLNLQGSHPASRFRIYGSGYFKARDQVIEFNKNITYKRGYSPLKFWYTNGKMSTKQKYVEFERHSLLEMTYLKGKYGKFKNKYYLNCTFANGETTRITSDFYVDLGNYQTALTVNFTPNASEQLLMDGWYRDQRHAQLRVWRTYEDFEISDVICLTRLNHSRMLTSLLIWRPDIKEDLKDFVQTTSNDIWEYSVSTANFWTNYIKSEAIETITDIWLDAKPIVQDFLEDVRDVKNLEDDIDWIKDIFNDAYYNNEFYMKDIYNMYQVLAEEIAFREKMAHVPKLVNELWEVMGETGETMRKSILWLVETIKNAYEKTVDFLKGIVTGESFDQMSLFIRELIGKYDDIIKDMHISFSHYMEELWAQVTDFMTHYMAKSIMSIEPSFIQFVHNIESVFWDSSKKVLEFLYEKQTELLKNPVFNQKFSFTKDLDAFYEDLTKYDFLTNLKKYVTILYNVITKKYVTMVPFGKELNEIGSEIVGGMSELKKLPFVTFTLDLLRDMYSQAEWLYNYLNLNDKLESLLPILYHTVRDLMNTALDNEIINHAARTIFIFEPDRGRIVLKQTLPIPWHAFNETPNYAEIPEYKMISKIQKFLSPKNKTFWSYYYKYAPIFQSDMWFPPFDTQALIIGNRYIMTFDKVSYQFSPQCSYLLANDFMKGTFSLILRYVSPKKYLISILVHNKVINVDLLKNQLEVEGEKVLHLPFQLNDTFISAQEGLAVIESKNGFTLKCNFKYDVCGFKISGWYFGKTAGLLGTVDNEAKTDYLTSYGYLDSNVTSFVKSWGLGTCHPENERSVGRLSPANSEHCNSLFTTKISSFAPCFSVINPLPFNEMCLKSIPSVFDDEICSAAYAYIEACKNEFIPLKIPQFCVECSINDISIDEGVVHTLRDRYVPRSTDVVFIMEAKECNQYMRAKRLVSTFVTILTKELASVKLLNNRFAVITYGGDGVFDKPRSVLVNNNIFTNEKMIPKFFERIKSGNGNTDIFGALKYATMLQFRPGVSKTFILIPCSGCDLSNMTVEYGVLSQEFIEKNITLHVLMNTDFNFQKFGISKIFYGLDSERAYTKTDYQGDMELRSQIKLTKSMMGYCTPLALETNGTIFTGKRMGSENLTLVKKFCNAFARRIASSAHPDPCQNCECGADENGIEIVECSPCSVPIPAYSDFYFKDNGTSFLQQAFEQFGADSNFN
ncbi:apolipophorins [Cimex lectularius]|uniref:Vitellogenin domain-containing protein n=1 Tax=Cimex lectularius TaxID=79782 RepID=A0A8I6TL46_CIMLE|nr:apolipophorins [Cimex lectularius]